MPTPQKPTFGQTIQMKKQFNKNYFNFGGDYHRSFFKPYTSFADAKNNVKALAFYPLVDTFLMLHALQDALIKTTLGLANLGIGLLTFSKADLYAGYKNVKGGAMSLVEAIVFTLSIVTDTLQSLVRLVTHSLSTVGLGISKTAQAIASRFESKPEQEPNLNHKM